MKTDHLEKLRRLKRSFEANLTFRKTVILVCCGLVFLVYFGPSFLSWLFGYHTRIRSKLILKICKHKVIYLITVSGSSCVNDKIIQHSTDLAAFNAHVQHRPFPISGDSDFLPYVGNGLFGLSLSDISQELFISTQSSSRTLTVPVSFKPLITVKNDLDLDSKSAKVVNYVKGLIHDVTCYDDGLEGSSGDISISRQIYAHRTIPEVLVQEIRITNPTGADQLFQLERLGISNWKSASSSEKIIEHGDGNKKYAVISGLVSVPSDSPLSSSLLINTKEVMMVAIVVPEIDENLSVKARMTHTMTFLSSISYSKPMQSESLAKELRQKIEDEAVNGILQAAAKSSQSLREEHFKTWRSLWTTGFGISHSMAEEAVNGGQVNATIYYVLSQTPTPLHSAKPVDQSRKAELQSYLAYLEGCYGGLPTL